jgi:hypothetical protein
MAMFVANIPQYFDDAYGYILSWSNQRPSDAKPLELLIEMTDEDAYSMLTCIEPLWGVSSTTCTAEAICSITISWCL